jgi:hypothetical protein
MGMIPNGQEASMGLTRIAAVDIAAYISKVKVGLLVNAKSIVVL